MLNKVCSLARAVSIILAVIAGFVAIPAIDVALLLVGLGVISGVTMERERMTTTGVIVLVLPMVGGALGHIPMIGEHLGAVAGNIALAASGALGSAIAMVLFGRVRDDLTGMAK